MGKSLDQSPLSSVHLRQKPQRFERIIGMSVERFDRLVERIKEHRLRELRQKRVLWEDDRIQRLHERTSTDLAEQVCITLLYQRHYMTQEVLSACFDLEQGSVCTIIQRIEPWLEASLATPEALSSAVADAIEAMAPEAVEGFQAILIGDGTEQPTERPSDESKQRRHYSGKKTSHQ